LLLLFFLRPYVLKTCQHGFAERLPDIEAFMMRKGKII